MYDTYPHLQVIAAGSPSFDLQNNTAEPMIGRKKTFHLYPLSYKELADSTSSRETQRLLETRLVYGSYPDVINNPGEEKEMLVEIAQSYLYTDIFELENRRKPQHLEKLLKALAFQVDGEASYNELAQIVGNIDTTTVEKYLDLLEKAFVIFKLSSFHRNRRNEIKKTKKYYSYDTGIRNVLISNFSALQMRQDKGALWENFVIAERLKSNQYHNRFVNPYFWRTKDQAAIDYIEEE